MFAVIRYPMPYVAAALATFFVGITPANSFFDNRWTDQGCGYNYRPCNEYYFERKAANYRLGLGLLVDASVTRATDDDDGGGSQVTRSRGPCMMYNTSFVFDQACKADGVCEHAIARNMTSNDVFRESEAYVHYYFFASDDSGTATSGSGSGSSDDLLDEPLPYTSWVWAGSGSGSIGVADGPVFLSRLQFRGPVVGIRLNAVGDAARIEKWGFGGEQHNSVEKCAAQCAVNNYCVDFGFKNEQHGVVWSNWTSRTTPASDNNLCDHLGLGDNHCYVIMSIIGVVLFAVICLAIPLVGAFCYCCKREPAPVGPGSVHASPYDGPPVPVALTSSAVPDPDETPPSYDAFAMMMVAGANDPNFNPDVSPDSRRAPGPARATSFV